MARMPVPVDLQKGEMTERERIARKKNEEMLKGNKISNKIPSNLNKNAKKIYKNLLEHFPDGFLSQSDSINLEILAQTIYMMYEAQKDIDECGTVVDGKVNQSIVIYEKCTKIIDIYSKKLGLSPKDRAALGYMMFQQAQEDEDPLLKILQG